MLKRYNPKSVYTLRKLSENINSEEKIEPKKFNVSKSQILPLREVNTFGSCKSIQVNSCRSASSSFTPISPPQTSYRKAANYLNTSMFRKSSILLLLDENSKTDIKTETSRLDSSSSSYGQYSFVFCNRIIKIQSFVRSALVRKRFKKYEEMRKVYYIILQYKRSIYEKNLLESYNFKFETIVEKIRKKIYCKEFKDAVNTLSEYAFIVKSPDVYYFYLQLIVFDAPTRKRYLFQLCDKNNDGKLTKNEFEILAIQILGIYVDEKTTKMLFPDDENITYEDFRDWLCGKVINGLSKLSEIKCKLLQKLRKVDNYPYMYIYNILQFSYKMCIIYKYCSIWTRIIR